MEPTTKKWLIWGAVAVAALVLLWLVFRNSGSSGGGVQDVGVGGISFGNSASSLAALGAFGGGIPGVKINPGGLATGTDTGSSVASTGGAGSTSKKTPAPAPHPVPSNPTPVVIAAPHAAPWKPAPVMIAATGPGSYNPGIQAPPPGAPAINPGNKRLTP